MREYPLSSRSCFNENTRHRARIGANRYRNILEDSLSRKGEDRSASYIRQLSPRVPASRTLDSYAQGVLQDERCFRTTWLACKTPGAALRWVSTECTRRSSPKIAGADPRTRARGFDEGLVEIVVSAYRAWFRKAEERIGSSDWYGGRRQSHPSRKGGLFVGAAWRHEVPMMSIVI